MSRMLDESKEAAARVAALLAADGELYAQLGKRLRELDPAVVATIARGSSDHAANYASYLIPHCLGKVVASIPPSLVSVLGAKLALKDQLVLAISQSGRSPDLIASFHAAKHSGAMTAAIVNDTTSPLAALAESVLGQHAGPEGIAATKSVLCSFTAVARLTAEWSADKDMLAAIARLPEAMERAHLEGSNLDPGLLNGVTNAYVVSRGLGLSAAMETALKLKETCGIHAEPFSTAEVRHGPREIVEDGFLVVALALPGSGRDDVLKAADELRAQGGRVVLIDLDGDTDASDARLSPILVLQRIYPWLALASVFLGYDPDRPRTLTSKIIQTY